MKRKLEIKYLHENTGQVLGINANPRTENACIQINEDIFKFYKDYFDGIKSIL